MYLFLAKSKHPDSVYIANTPFVYMKWFGPPGANGSEEYKLYI